MWVNLAGMGKAAREIKRRNRMLRQARRFASAEQRFVDRFTAAYTRWNDHRGGELHDSCPACGALVIIKPKVDPGQTDGVFEASHQQPVCDPFIMVLTEMGAHSPRLTTRHAS